MGGVDVFLTSALVAGEWSASRPDVTHRIGGWLDLRADPGNLEKLKCLLLPGLEL
jgi:hypothetical protein